MKRLLLTAALAAFLLVPAAQAATGLGAWSFGYYRYGMAVPNDRVAAGIHAMKQELIYNGFAAGIDLSVAKFGWSASARTKDFQAAHGLTASGLIGPTTARYLFRKRSYTAAGVDGIPHSLNCRQKTLESANDPVAQGYADPEDEGLEQINLVYNAAITLAQAWDPAFSITWSADQMKSAYQGDGQDWDGAVAAYNVGLYYASQWVAAGKPSSGLTVDGIDWYARAYRYVQLVKASAC